MPVRKFPKMFFVELNRSGGGLSYQLCVLRGRRSCRRNRNWDGIDVAARSQEARNLRGKCFGKGSEPLLDGRGRIGQDSDISSLRRGLRILAEIESSHRHRAIGDPPCKLFTTFASVLSSPASGHQCPLLRVLEFHVE